MQRPWGGDELGPLRNREGQGTVGPKAEVGGPQAQVALGRVGCDVCISSRCDSCSWHFSAITASSQPAGSAYTSDTRNTGVQTSQNKHTPLESTSNHTKVTLISAHMMARVSLSLSEQSHNEHSTQVHPCRG